jgi:acetyl esterase/lipase
MNTKKLFTILILLFIILSITACEEDTDDRPPLEQSCGDGVCDERESKKGFCPEDCQDNDIKDNDKDQRLEELKQDAIANFNGEVIENLEYANVDGTSLLLDLYLPDTEETLPVIVWVHGGAWTAGSKDDVANYIVLIASNDYVVVSMDHRPSSQTIFPAQIHDVKAAIRYLRANPNNYNYNPENIGAVGSSSGGHLVSLLGTSANIEELEGEVGTYLEYSSTVQAVVDLFGPVNIQTLTEDCENLCLMDHDTSTSPESGLLGCRPSECPDEASEASATTYISADDPPFLIIHGDEDLTISYLQSQNFNQLLQDNGLESEFILAEGYGHDRSMAKVYLDEIIDFFDSHLKD